MDWILCHARAENPSRAWSDFCPHLENVLLPTVPIFFLLAFHIFSSVLRQYEFAGFNTTKPTCITRRMRIQKNNDENTIKKWKLFVHWSHLGAPSPVAPVFSSFRFHSGDIYSFLFLILICLRPNFSSVGLDDLTESLGNFWAPRVSFFS